MRFYFPTTITTRRINALHLFLLLLSIGSIHANAQTAGEQDVQLLDSRQPIKRTISCGEYHYYRIMLVTDQYLRLVVDQRGVDVSVKLYQPDGNIVAESNRMIGAYGPETIAWVAETSGSYKLEVRSAATQQVGAHYEVKILEERTATSQDRDRIAAQDVFMQAEQLREQKTPSSLEQAIAKYETARRMWKDIGNPSGEAETLGVLGLIYHLSKGDPVKAQQHFQDALKTQQAAGDRRGEAESLSNLARLFESGGERQTALDYYNRSLQPWVDSGDRYGEAWTLFNIGQVHLFLKEANKALDHYNRALQLWRDLGDLSREASTLNGIGDSYFSISDFQNARNAYEQALRKWQDAQDVNGQVSTLFSISRTYGELKDRNRESEFRRLAEQLRSRPRQACTRPPDIQAKSDTVRQAEQAREEARALLLQNTDDSQRKAIEKNEEAVKLFDKAGDYDREVATLFDISSIYRTLNDKSNERKTLERSMSLAQRAGKPSLRAETLQRFAAFHSDYGDQLKAADYYDRAIEVLRRQRDRRSEAFVLGIAAKIYANLDNREKAVAYLERALALYQDLGDRFREAYTLDDLAAIYLESDEKQRALDYLKRALNLRHEKGDRAGEAETLKEIAAVYLSIGDKSKVLDYYHQSLELYVRIRDGMGQAETLSGLMDYWKDLNRPALAIFYGKQAVNTYQDVRRNIQGLEKETQTIFLKSKEDIYRELADLLISEGRLPEAQQVLDLLKEEEFNNFIRGGRRKSSASELVELSAKENDYYKEYKEKTDRATAISREYDELDAKPAKNPDESRRFAELTAEVQTVNAAFRNYLAFLSEKLISSDKKETIAQHEDLKATLKELGPGAVALYTLVVKDKYRVVLFTPRLKVARMSSIKTADLNRKIMAFRLALQDPKSDPLPLAKELYQILIGPIVNDLEGAKAQTLMWSLDGALRYVPIAALHDGNQYVVERFRNQSFFGINFSQLGEAPAPSWRGLGLGVSRFPGDLNPLPAVVEELTGIFRNEDNPNATGGTVPGKIILDDKFTKDAMIETLQSHQYQVVHVASHFMMKPGDGMASYLVLGKGNRLTVAQVGDLPAIFFGVDLLTLSACNTAMAGTGKEVNGLARVVQQQGAKAVIASLWSVSDASTGRLMQKLYEVRVRNSEPASKAESLQKAQLAFLHKEITAPDPNAKDYSHPYFWAPFILIGNWR